MGIENLLAIYYIVMGIIYAEIISQLIDLSYSERFITTVLWIFVIKTVKEVSKK